MRALIVILCAATVAFAVMPPARVAAQNVGCIDRLNDAEIDARYQTIYQTFEQEQRPDRLFYYGWITFFSGMTTGSLIFAGLNVNGKAPRYYASAIGSGLSLLSFLVFPRAGLKGAYGARRLRRMPAATIEQRRARLAYAQQLLESSAAHQFLGSNILSHGQGFAYGLGAGLVLGLKYHDTVGALTLALGAPAINEVRAFTSPTRSMRAWEMYRGTADNCMAPTLHDYPPPPTKPIVNLDAGLGRVALTVRWF